MHDPQPLAGIKVIDFTQVMLGPCCTQTLGDYGADVIKIERIGAGDLSRSSIEDPAGQLNPIFCSLNRNKRSIALDLKSPAGIAVVHRLVARRRCRREQLPRRRHGADGSRLRRALGDQSAHHIRLRHGVRHRGPVFAQGRPGHPGPGDERGHGPQVRSIRAADDLSHGARRLFGRNASCAGDPAGAACSGSGPDAASRSRYRSTTACWRCRCRKPRCG